MSKRVNILSAGMFQPILPLTLMCDSVALDANNPLMVAIIGPGPCILNVDPATIGLPSPRPTRAQLATMVNAAMEYAADSDAMRELPAVCEGVPAVQLIAVFFLWSMESPFAVYRWVTNPLNVSGTRTVESLQQQLPLIKLLCIAHRCIPRKGALWYDGVLYRGINKDLNPVMKTKYDTYETAFAVGSKLTFPAPTACSTSDVVAGDFTNGIQLVIQNAGGVSLLPGQLSAYDESEVMLPFPSSFKVIARSKVQDTVVVVVEAIPTAVSYCSLPEPSLAPHAAPASSPPPPVSSTAAAAASPGGDLDDDDIAVLMSEMQGMQLATKKAMRAIACALADGSIVTLKHLKKMTAAKARELLQRAGMQEFQIDTVMELYGPPAPAPAHAPSLAPVPAVVHVLKFLPSQSNQHLQFSAGDTTVKRPGGASCFPAAVALHVGTRCRFKVQLLEAPMKLNTTSFGVATKNFKGGIIGKVSKSWGMIKDFSAAELGTVVSSCGEEIKTVRPLQQGDVLCADADFAGRWLDLSVNGERVHRFNLPTDVNVADFRFAVSLASDHMLRILPQ